MLRFPTLTVLPKNASAATKLTWPFERAQGWDRHWRETQFDQIPADFQLPVAQNYCERWQSAGERDANLFLLETVERLAGLAINPKTSDDELCGVAKRIALSCRDVLGRNGNRPYTADYVLRICTRYGIRPPKELSRYGNGTGSVTDTVTVLDTVADTFPPSFSDRILGQGTIARLTDDAWWRRGLRIVHGRVLEAEAIRLHLVHRYAGRYVSDTTLARHQQQRRRNQRVLARLIAVNEEGDLVALSELFEHSLANPAIRRSELMARIYGFEQVAKDLGHDAVFLTVTCPSRMHAHFGKSGAPNPTFEESCTPRIAQDYLTQLWSRIRSKLQRENLRPYGFRIAEPHHDGTPHWHLLLFIAPEEIPTLVSVIRSYALADSPDEPGAQEHRFRVEKIDPTKGSATGYVAKYIAKNVDGFGLSASEDKPSPATSAERVAAWASTWGIRQFQQIGGVPVGLWREFRRAPALTSSPGLIGELAKAADQGNCAAFIQLAGGPQQARKELSIGLEKVHDRRPGRYGEAIGLRVAGIRHDNVVFSTRFHTWTIKPKTEDHNCTLAAGLALEESKKGATIIGLPPWSSVNNCILAPKELLGNEEYHRQKHFLKRPFEYEAQKARLLGRPNLST